WEKLTGMSAGDLTGVASEVVLDWLFPQQTDRDLVADLLHQPVARRLPPGRGQGMQAVLELLSPGGTSRPMRCAFVPAPSTGAAAWLLLASEPDLFPGEALLGETGSATRFVRQFVRGLSHLLNNYLTVPIGLSELALDRSDLPAELRSWFEQIFESCMRAHHLIGALFDLGTLTPGDTQLLPLATLVREFLDERRREQEPEPPYELLVELCAPDALVRVNRRMLQVVLKHLFTNAEQSLLHSERKRIAVRVFARENTVVCEIED